MSIKNDQDRNKLINCLPPSANGGTSIGSGILKGIDVSNNKWIVYYGNLSARLFGSYQILSVLNKNFKFCLFTELDT